MKKINTLVLLKSYLMISAITFACVGNSIGQTTCNSSTYFVSASNPEYNTDAGYTCSSAGVTTITDVVHTGNDSRYNSSFASRYGNGYMVVNVWDGSHPGFGWDDRAGHTCNLALASSAVDPDVVLVAGHDQSLNVDTWYAIVVYVGASNFCKYDLYEWDWSSNAFTQVSGYPMTLYNYLTNAATCRNSINVDADQDGNFAIVWDDNDQTSFPNYVDIQVFVGTCTTGSGNGPVLSSNGAVILSATSIHHMMPDVSIFNDGNGHVRLWFTYLLVTNYTYPANPGAFLVTYDNFDSLLSGISRLSGYYAVNVYFPPNKYFLNPRIACPPNTNSADSVVWTAVVEYHDVPNGINDIRGYSSDGSTFYSNIYTNGRSASPCDISSSSNQFPVVSYNGEYTGLMVGWQSDKVNTNTGNGTSCVALTCDITGALNSCISPNPYLIVADNNYGAETVLSMSGRDAYDGSTDNMYYTYYYGTSTSDIIYKWVPFCSPNLRIGKHPVNDPVTVYPNPFNNELNIDLSNSSGSLFSANIRDVTGKILLQVSGNETEINKALNDLAGKLAQGIYLLHVETVAAKTINQRIVKI